MSLLSFFVWHFFLLVPVSLFIVSLPILRYKSDAHNTVIRALPHLIGGYLFFSFISLNSDFYGTLLSYMLTVVYFQRSLYPPSLHDDPQNRRALMDGYVQGEGASYYRYPSSILHSQRYFHLKRGAALFIQSWFPNDGQDNPSSSTASLSSLATPSSSYRFFDRPSSSSSSSVELLDDRSRIHSCVKAIILFVHGYGDHSNGLFPDTARRLVAEGYGVYAFDQYAHGRSDGLHTMIDNFPQMLDDTASVIITLRNNHPDKKIFLLAESMGGAVALHVSLKYPSLINGGLVLLAPMLCLKPEIQPSPLATRLLKFLLRFICWAPIVPSAELIRLCLRDDTAYHRALRHPLLNRRRPRLATANEMKTVCDITEKILHLFTIPFIVLHGEDDRVTDPATSRLLYQEAASKDKSIKIYEKAYHALLVGEPAEMKDRIFGDVFQWINQRL